MNLGVLEFLKKMSVSPKERVGGKILDKGDAAQLWGWGWGFPANPRHVHEEASPPQGKLRGLSHFSILQTFFSVNQPIGPLGTQAEFGSRTQEA